MNIPDRFGYVVPGANAWLANVLTHPAQAVDLPGLAANWQRTVVHVICERPPGLEEGLWMAGAVRGAWLSMLHGMPRSSPIDPDPLGRPLPFEAFYLSHARVTRRNDVPKPYWIEVDLLPGQRLLIRLTLFGFADLWRDAAIEALLLSPEHGVSLRGRAPIDAPWPVLDWHWTLERFIDLRAPALHAVASIAGLSLRGKRGIDGADMLMRAAERVSGLSRWRSIRLDIDWGNCVLLSRNCNFPWSTSRRRCGTECPGIMAPFQLQCLRSARICPSRSSANAGGLCSSLPKPAAWAEATLCSDMVPSF